MTFGEGISCSKRTSNHHDSSGVFTPNNDQSQRGGSSLGNTSREVINPKQANPLLSYEPFEQTFTVIAYTESGLQYPNHSITFEIYVNGILERSMESTKPMATFRNVHIKRGDIVSGRALWRNGYGSVQQIYESFQAAYEVLYRGAISEDKTRGFGVCLETYPYESMSKAE